MSAFTGVGSLVRLILRRDRIYLPVWILAIVGTIYASVAAVRRTYDTPVEIASYAVNVGGSPATVAMDGPPFALDTVGGILIYETSLTGLLAVSLMAVFTVVRHTRGEEDAGRVELLGSTVVNPHAVITAAVLVSGAASLLVGAGVTVSFLAEAQPTAESLLYGSAVAALGLVFTGVAACAAQLMSHARGAIGASIAFLGVAFGLRAIGDVQESFLSWLSPMGWSQQVSVYDQNRWWPISLSLGLTAVLIVATVVLEGRRDLGSGLVPSRPGPATAGASLGSVIGLTWRLQRGSVVAWAFGLLATGMLFGSFSQSVENLVRDNPTFAEYFETLGRGSVVDAFFATSFLLMAIVASGFAVSSALRTHGEEVGDRLEQVLATAVSRPRWLLGSLVVTLLGSVLIVALGGLGLGITYAATAGSGADVLRMTWTSLAYLPATLVLAALAVLLVGWLPHQAPLAWAGVAVCFVVGWLGNLLDLPGWVKDLSPFTHVPAVPSETLNVAPLVVLGLLVALAVSLGAVGFRRRDLV